MSSKVEKKKAKLLYIWISTLKTWTIQAADWKFSMRWQKLLHCLEQIRDQASEGKNKLRWSVSSSSTQWEWIRNKWKSLNRACFNISRTVTSVRWHFSGAIKIQHRPRRFANQFSMRNSLLVCTTWISRDRPSSTPSFLRGGHHLFWKKEKVW